ncbi:MAG: hypothetical protein ONB16_02720 [candidate division KSB1 bacterium]|nr:hypothetical protein [candidate division KSB1 bacterium]MDZ7317845.1 hypothetical protein [candidate division KSB1 bacterium]MDZ7340339.1 hypothetical protein [candidate division KSB1 bacterium]
MVVGRYLKNIMNWFLSKLKKPFLFLNRHRLAPAFFIIFSALPLLAIFATVVMLPLWNDLNNNLRASATSDMTSGAKISSENPILAESIQLAQKKYQLKTEEAFLQAQLQMSKSDSIGLCINLRDSVISLLIRGVDVRTCKIEQFRISHAFKHLQASGAALNWLSTSFTLQRDWASIPKAPIKVKMAPKDTLEANQSKSEPYAELGKNDVYLTLQFDRNLMVHIRQTQTPSWRGRLWKLIYGTKFKFYILEDRITALVQGHLPTNLRWIELEIAQNDAVAIYRAIPHRALLALRL